MSMDRCSDCGSAIDTDYDCECYLEHYADKCVCETCRDKYACPACYSWKTHEAHHEGDAVAPECDYKVCEDCGH